MFNVTGMAGQPVSALARTYAGLSCCFSPPEGELLEAILSGALARDLGVALLSLGREVAPMPGGLVEPVVDADSLVCEYSRLFAGPGLPAAPPYESAWRERTGDQSFGPLNGPVSRDVLAEYRRAGLNFDAVGECPDHIAVELAFVSWLYVLETQEVEHDGTSSPDTSHVRRSFLSRHLLEWAMPFAVATERAAGTGFYAGAALLLRYLVEFERSRLALSSYEE